MKGPIGGELHGTTIIGARGQVVVPLEVRKKMALKQNDKLLVITNKDMIILAKSDDFNRFLDKFLTNITQIKKKISKV